MYSLIPSMSPLRTARTSALAQPLNTTAAIKAKSISPVGSIFFTGMSPFFAQVYSLINYKKTIIHRKYTRRKSCKIEKNSPAKSLEKGMAPIKLSQKGF
jgi:hypothetical protein